MTVSERVGRIYILPEHLRNRIAAGEVVQRPASVVKELVENSLDAGAEEIRVAVTRGGLDEITVTDDGAGMTPEELAVAVQAHATSKISRTDDLEAIDSLGFRGEALASIASVSHLRIFSRTRESDLGAEIAVDGGEPGDPRPRGGPVGTRVQVRNLFFNTPARRKHMGAVRTEMSHVTETIRELALAHPGVSFHLHREGERVLFTSGAGDLHRCLVELFGAGAADELLCIGGGDDRIDGYVGTPVLSRARRDRQYFVVNGRIVQHPGMRAVLERAYSGFLERGRFPFAAISLRLPPGRVDVNIHPTKREIKILEGRSVLGSLHNRVREALLQMPPPQWKVADQGTGDVCASPDGASGPDPERAAESQVSYFPSGPDGGREDAEESGSMYDRLRPMGQLDDTYIVASGPGGLYLVDQHAACERLYYEHGLAALREGISYSQRLAVPRTIELDGDQMQCWREFSSDMESMGYEAEEFGGGTLIVQAVPVFLDEAASPQLVAEVLEELGEVGATRSSAEMLATATASCKRALRAGDRLGESEMKYLFRQMSRLQQPNTCPHGRPTLIEISRAQIARMFSRR